MTKTWIYILPLAVFALMAVFAALPMIRGKSPTYVPTTLVGGGVPEFSIDGLTSTDIQGPALVNVFSSWCVPCKGEHPFLMALSQRDNVRVYGIVYKDSKEAREKLLQQMGNPYTQIGDDPHGLAAISFGISGVPTTFVIDENGMITHRFDGPLTPQDIDQIILPTMKGDAVE